MWIVLSFVSCFLSAVAAVYRKSGIKGQNPFWYGAISLTISTITIFITINIVLPLNFLLRLLDL